MSAGLVVVVVNFVVDTAAVNVGAITKKNHP